MVLTSRNSFAENSVHENLDGTVIGGDQETESGQNIQADYDNIVYENQGVEYEGESVPEIVTEHEHEESSGTQECVNNGDEQDDRHVTDANAEDVDALTQEPLNDDDQTLKPTQKKLWMWELG